MSTFILSALGFAFTVFVIAVLLDNMLEWVVYDGLMEDEMDRFFGGE